MLSWAINHLFRKGFMAETTGLEPATSAVTAKRKIVTNGKQTSRMASFGAVRNDQIRLLNPQWTRVLCPVNLCPDLYFKAKVAGLLICMQ
jgi:hypothetical protein